MAGNIYKKAFFSTLNVFGNIGSSTDKTDEETYALGQKILREENRIEYFFTAIVASVKIYLKVFNRMEEPLFRDWFETFVKTPLEIGVVKNYWMLRFVSQIRQGSKSFQRLKTQCSNISEPWIKPFVITTIIHPLCGIVI